MVHYRRVFAPGGTFFFTVTLKDRKSDLLIKRIDFLQAAIQKVKKQHAFQIKAYVVLPDHLHMIWELPQGDTNYSIRWKKIKAMFSMWVGKSGIRINKSIHNESQLWQRRFWEHTIRDEYDYENHVNYIHYNPIKHGLVSDLEDWPHSSFHYFLKNGRVDKNWGKAWMHQNSDSEYGE